MLELPIDSDFVSLAPRSNTAEIVQISAAYVWKLCLQPEFRKFRAEDRCDVEFDLENPGKVPASYPAGLIDEVLGEAFRA